MTDSCPERLRIGRIPYANLYPLFSMLERQEEASRYEFVEGVPSALNALLREGKIDISPSSSIEHLRHPDRYVVVPNHSVSSAGPVGSVFLFSRNPIEGLDGETVLATSQSETSVALLSIVLKIFRNLQCRVVPASGPLEEEISRHPAYLLIGDDALLGAGSYAHLLRYDLGELWYRETGLPFTYALWLMRKDCCSGHTAGGSGFRESLDRAKDAALADLGAIARACPLNRLIRPERLIEYWQTISYDFSDRHRQGLSLFETYCRQLGLL